MKVSSAKGNPELLKQIGEAFSVIPGIERVSVNPTTGSVVLHYDTDRHKEFHNHLDEQCRSSAGRGYGAPNTEIDVLARNIQEEAEFLAENSQSAKAVVTSSRSSIERSGLPAETWLISRSCSPLA